MAVIVSDTSPIRALSHLALLDLLRQLYGQVLVPPAVVWELQHPPPGLLPVDVSQFPFVQVRAPQNQSQVQQLLQALDPGESEALALAVETQLPLVIDELSGRSVAQQLGLRFIGTLGVLVEAKLQGLIPLVRPLIDDLENNLGFFISAKLRAEVFRLAGE